MFRIYHFENLERLSIPCDIVSLSYTDFTKNEPSLPHAHPYTEIMVVVEGNGFLVAEQQNIPFEKGKLYFVNPHIEHLESSDKTLKYYVLKISNFTVCSKNEYSPIVELGVDYTVEANILSRLAQIWNNCTPKSEYQKEILCLDLSAFYYYVLHLLNSRHHINQTITELYSPKIQAVVDYISANYASELKITEIAKKFAFSHNNLIYRFQKEIGMSPSDFITRQRIMAAKGLLKNTDYSVGQIASLCGFSYSSFFGKTFKKNEGISPSLYRARFKQ